MAEEKTNAVRMLETANIPFRLYTYACKEALDGITVAGKIGIEPERCFKTLVTVGSDRKNYVFVLPANEELDLKKAARSVGVKSIEMLHMVDLRATTGYVRGGCSPVGMSKSFPTYFAEEVILVDTMVCSAGKVGHQVEVRPDDLIGLIGGEIADLVVG